MEPSPKLVKHRPDDSSQRMRGASSPVLLVALLVFLVAVGGIVAWTLFASSTPSSAPAAPKVEKSDAPEPAPPTDTQGAEPLVSETPQPARDPEWEKGINGLQRIEVVDGKKRTKTVLDTYSLIGDCVDDETSAPVYFFSLYLIPTDRGDVVTAAKSWSPSRFRDGKIALERQPAGIYNVLCESPEHDAWTGQIKIPFDGQFHVRLKRGTVIMGTVSDSSQTPLEGIEIQLIVDPTRLDGGADPPTTRLKKTDKMGHYSFNKIPTGVYGLRAMLMSDELQVEPDFRVDPGAKVIRDITLQRMGSIKVVAKNIADQGVARARVMLVVERDGRERSVRMGLTDLHGVARIDFVRDGSYKLRVAAQGFETFEQDVAVSSGDSFREVPVQLAVAQKPGH